MKRAEQHTGSESELNSVPLAIQPAKGFLSSFRWFSLAFFFLCILPPACSTALAQESTAPALLPLPDPATREQIREYLQISGEAEAYRARWIAAVDRNRSIGSPYWPESFWTEIKTRMKVWDLTPTYVSRYQHTVSRELMMQILETYRTLGAKHFEGTPACFMLGGTQQRYKSDIDQLGLSNTLAVIRAAYAVYKPQIEVARAKYIAEHPDWKDK